MTIIYIIIGLVILWSLWGYFSSRVERTEYSVIKVKGDSVYEIRNYPKHIVAQTVVKGPYREALNQGFRIVAGYIFGGNASREKIAMTSPVVENTSKGQAIAMTSPVTASMEGEMHTIAFGMPRSYTLETLPIPTDNRVKLVTRPERKMAVICFSWFRSDSRVSAKKSALLSALKKDAITTVGEPYYAGYNAPWTPPWMNRNEVLVEVK